MLDHYAAASPAIESARHRWAAGGVKALLESTSEAGQILLDVPVVLTHVDARAKLLKLQDQQILDLQAEIRALRDSLAAQSPGPAVATPADHR